MARPKSNGPYAPLSATYYLDDAILEAGEKAELLFCRGLAYCSSNAADGYITERQLAAIGLGLRGIIQRAQRLVDVGVWTRVPGGYNVRAWLKWNKSAEEIGRHLRADRERKAGGFRPESDGIPDGEPPDSRDQINVVQGSSMHFTESSEESSVNRSVSDAPELETVDA